MLTEVLDLVSHGLWPIRVHYPIFTGEGVKCSCGRPRCDQQGKHPVAVEWGKSASQDADILEEQFTARTPWNVGIILGLCHGIPADQAIIDIEDDTLEGRALADTLLRDCHCPAYSSGKSLHRIFRWSDKLPPVANMTINGLEFRFGGRGKETQSVAPPSRHNSGRYYEWLPGRSLTDLTIPQLPEHIIEYICEEYARQADSSPKGSSSVDPRKFRSPRGKIGPGARHHSLLVEANNLWRIAYKVWGINGFEEQEVIDQVWMWLGGANLLVCDPPKTEAEVQVIFKSSQKFMYGEILREIEAQTAKIDEETAPQPAEEGDDTFGSWLLKHGVVLQKDKGLNPIDESPDRIDEWRCNWRMEYLTNGDEDLIAVHFPEINGIESPSIMTHVEFQKHDSFARRVQQDTKGRMCLDRSFSYWNWKTIWDGKKNGKKSGKKNDKKVSNGITRGLREFLLSKAEVVQNVHQDLADQIEDLIHAMAGNFDSVKTGLVAWLASPVSEVPEFRLKCRSPGSLCSIRAPEDPLTGWYWHENEILLLVKMDELNRRYRSSYGSGVANRLVSDALTGEKLGFEKRKFRDGVLAGRWFCKSFGGIE